MTEQEKQQRTDRFMRLYTSCDCMDYEAWFSVLNTFDLCDTYIEFVDATSAVETLNYATLIWC